MRRANPYADQELKLSRGTVQIVQGDYKGVVTEGQTIVIVPGEKSETALMDTFIHEALHVTLPRLSEAEVVRVAGDLCKVLYSVGYRRVKPRKVSEG